MVAVRSVPRRASNARCLTLGLIPVGRATRTHPAIPRGPNDSYCPPFPLFRTRPPAEVT
jgi:hypothetical protein